MAALSGLIRSHRLVIVSQIAEKVNADCDRMMSVHTGHESFLRMGMTLGCTMPQCKQCSGSAVKCARQASLIYEGLVPHLKEYATVLVPDYYRTPAEVLRSKCPDRSGQFWQYNEDTILAKWF